MRKYKLALITYSLASLVACTQQNPAPVVSAVPDIYRPKITHLASKQQQKHIKPNWVWPVKGPAVLALKGLDIDGQEGTPVYAARDGEVVYSGNGLKEYGNLIIIKHDKNFITAYAHNKKNMVKEGDKVVIGQTIAEMGKTGTNKVKLHFEVRHQGKPINPQQILPAK